MPLVVKPSLSTKKTKENNEVEKFSPLFNTDEAKLMRDRFIEQRMDDIYSAKMKSFDKDSDKMRLCEGYRLDSEFITTRVLEALPTGDVRFDLKVSLDKFGNRGIPRGKVLELSGAPETMKSARAYAIAAAIQQDSRGAIVHIYETESKANARYIGAAGCDTSRIILTLPDYVEQVYYDMERVMRKYNKARNIAVAEYIKEHYKKKSLSQNEFDELQFRARMSYPILVFIYDSIGNHISMEHWQKNQAGKTTKTIGKHAQAHADGFRSIKNILGTSMSVFIVINHTKVEMGGVQSSWGEKKTTTHGGDSIKYNSDVRIEHRNGVGINTGGMPSTLMKITRNKEEITVGKWLSAKFIKNGVIETSQQKINNIFFRYQNGVGFDMGVSYMIAMSEIGMVKGELKLGFSSSNKIRLPDGSWIDTTFPDFHDMLLNNLGLRKDLRILIEDNANKKSVLVRKDL